MPEVSEEMLRKLMAFAGQVGLDLDVQGSEPGAKLGASVAAELDIGGPTLDVAHELGMILRDRGLFRFRQGFVTVNEDDPLNMIEEMEAETFISWVQNFVVLQKYNAKSKEMVPANLTKAGASALMKSRAFRAHIPELKAVVPARLPVMRDGVEELLDRGYNHEEGIYVLRSAPDMDEEMDIEDAAEIYHDVFGEFPFDGPRSMAAHAAACLGLFCQFLLPEACEVPLFQFTANMEGSGKSLLGKSVVVPIYTLAGYGTTAYGEGDKFAESLNSIANSRKGYLFLDDVSTTLFNQDLNRWVTDPMWMFRKYHTQMQVSVPKRCMTIVTDNGCTLSDDLIRRTVIVRLAVDERASDREGKLKRRLSVHWFDNAENRGRMLSMWWSMVRHWRELGRPAAVRTIPSFTEWSNLVGGIVKAAEFDDPFAPAGMIDGGDKRRTEVDLLISQAVERFLSDDKSQAEIPMTELCAIARECGLFDYQLGELAMVRAEMDSHPSRFYDYTDAEENVLTEDQRHEQALRYMHPQKMGSPFSKRLKKHLGMKFRVNEREYRFTKLEKARTATYCIELVS